MIASPETLERFGGTPGLVYHAVLTEGRVVYDAAAIRLPAVLHAAPS